MRIMQRSSKQTTIAPREPAVEPDAGELIACGQTAAMAVINKFVDAEKASNPSLPREMLLQMAMHNQGCVCKVATTFSRKSRNECLGSMTPSSATLTPTR
jgi:hypothetical protein